MIGIFCFVLSSPVPIETGIGVRQGEEKRDMYARRSTAKVKKVREVKWKCIQ